MDVEQAAVASPKWGNRCRLVGSSLEVLEGSPFASPFPFFFLLFNFSKRQQFYYNVFPLFDILRVNHVFLSRHCPFSFLIIRQTKYQCVQICTKTWV